MVTESERTSRRDAGYMEERAPGVWTLRAWDPVNKRRKNKTFKGSKRDAGKALARHVADVSRNAKKEDRQAKAYRPTVEDAFREWARKGDLEGQSIDHGRYSYRFYGIGAMPLDGLTTEFLTDLTRRLLLRGGRCPCRNRQDPAHPRPCPRGKPLAKATVIRHHNDLHAVLQHAVDELHWLESNPAHKAKPRTRGKHREAKKQRSPSTDEVQRILDVARRDNPRLYVCLFLAAALGARAGEQCGMRWDQFDLDAGEVVIDRTIALQVADWDDKGSWGEKPYPKNDESRTLALDPTTVAILWEHRRFCQERAVEHGVVLADNAYLFSRYPDCRDPWRPNSVGAMFRAIRYELGIKGVRLHDLRRYFATQLIRAGIDLGRVQHAGGWLDSRMLLGIYNDTVKDADREVAAHMSGLLAPKPSLKLVTDDAG